jgi:hypothetical protein
VSASHLVRRFFGSVWPGGPRAPEESWVRGLLLPGEVELWARMPGADRRHAVGVAHRVEEALGEQATRPVLAAALLHDVGKASAMLGTYGRVVATLSGMLAGRETAVLWTQAGGFTRRVGLYLRHPEVGGDQLTLAGSDPLTVAWCREHHQPPERWTLPAPVAEALKAADDD